MTSIIPEFGIPSPGAEYILRPGGYAVIVNSAGKVALVATPSGVYLPGGGQENSESPEEAVIRETIEECGLRITLGEHIGVADELVFAESEGIYYRKRCSFFLATVMAMCGGGEGDHELMWVTVEEAVIVLRHESQRWAVLSAVQFQEG